MTNLEKNVQYERALDRATEVFGSKQQAMDWLEKANDDLGEPPVESLKNEEGYNRVLRHLHLIDLSLNLD